MASNINRVIITGNLGSDPDQRTTASGMTVLRFSVAVNDRTRQGDEWTDYTNWIDCVMFGRRAEAVSRYLSKGTKVAICGKLRFSKWQGDDGKNRSKIEVIVDDLEFMSRNESRNDAPKQQNSVFDSEIPF